MRRLLLATLCAGALGAQGQPKPADPDPARGFFQSAPVVRITITLAPAERQKLKEKPREYAPATLHLDGKTTWANVGVKLKGAAGSFRELDDRPGFTVHLGKFGEAHRLHGLQRFHLNNGVQDDTRLCEWLGSEVFAAAGYPAPRVAHARVWLDGADLGLYVLREAFDKQFLQRTFGTAAGSLYDGGFCQDIDTDLEKDAGDGPDDHSDLRRLRELCRGFDADRSARFEQAVDVPALVDFVALEAMLGHWDGYSQNRNNFRLWLAAPAGRATFLPHGMDQLLGDSDASVLAHPSAIVASTCLQHPEWRKRYRERLRELLPLLQPSKLRARLEAVAGKVRKELHAMDPAAASAHDAAVRGLQERLEARYRNLQAQVKAPEPRPLQFPGDRPVVLKTWRPAAETDDITLQKRSFQGNAALQITCGKRGDEVRHAAWRTAALLGRGRYRLQATARCADVVGPPVDEKGQPRGGAVLRVGDEKSQRLFGDQGWQGLVCEFEVTEFQRNVEFALDLRALAGTVWFRSDSLQLHRLPD